MSVSAISWAFGQSHVPTTPRFVLVAMADYADHRGVCWPAAETIAGKTGLSERSVRAALQELRDLGAIVPLSSGKGGRAATTRYQLNIGKGASDAGSEPEKGAPRAGNGADTVQHVQGNAGERVHHVPGLAGSLQENPAPGAENPAPRAPEPSGTVSKKEKEFPLTPRQAIEVVRPAPEPMAIPEWMPAEAWNDWVSFRMTRPKRADWTPIAAKLSVGKLTQLRSEGHDPAEVIEQSILAGWPGLYPVKSGRRAAESKTAWMHEPGAFDGMFGGGRA